jgi:hypothetical protein
MRTILLILAMYVVVACIVGMSVHRGPRPNGDYAMAHRQIYGDLSERRLC